MHGSKKTRKCSFTQEIHNKGTASYFSVRTSEGLVENIAWCYETSIPEMPKIAGRVCFYNEKTDITLDGELQVRPRTKWS